MWENTLDTEIEEWEWYTSYCDCFTWTVSTKLRSFYYQLRVGDIMSNKKLVSMKLKTDSTCQWCGLDNQDILHLFWECTWVRTIWQIIGKWISACLSNHLEIKKELIFLHDIEAGNYTIIINLIILIVTRYIYVCKCIEIRPHYTGALRKISEIEFTERCIARKNNQICKHNKKWRQFSHHL